MNLKKFVVAVVLASFAFVAAPVAFNFFGEEGEIELPEGKTDVEMEDVEGFLGNVKEFAGAIKDNVKKLIEEYIERD